MVNSKCSTQRSVTRCVAKEAGASSGRLNMKWDSSRSAVTSRCSSQTWSGTPSSRVHPPSLHHPAPGASKAACRQAQLCKLPSASPSVLARLVPGMEGATCMPRGGPAAPSGTCHLADGGVLAPRAAVRVPGLVDGLLRLQQHHHLTVPGNQRCHLSMGMLTELAEVCCLLYTLPLLPYEGM